MIIIGVENRPDVRFPDDEIAEAMEFLATELDDPKVKYICFEFLSDIREPV